MESLIASAATTIAASADVVWRALTDPEKIKRYMFGTTVVTDWKVGGPIVFRGDWEGRSYEDKGQITEFEKNKHLGYTYWSSFSGLEDKPENYGKVSCTLTAEDENSTKLTITQTGAKDEESKEKSERNWHMLLESVKAQIESGSL